MKDRIGLGRVIGLILAGMAIMLVLVGVVAVTFLGGNKIKGDIKKNLPRPGGGVSALLVQHDTWDHRYHEVFMRRNDGTSYLVFRANNSYEGPPNIVWADSRTLLIQMKCGAVEEYENGFTLGEEFGFKEIFIGLEGNKLCKEPAFYPKMPGKP